MTTQGVVDIVFCLDASASMQPCFDAVRNHITEFIAGLESNRQVKWDWRLDFVAHCASEKQGGGIFSAQSVHHLRGELVDMLYTKPATGGQGGPAGRFFTSNLNEFKSALGQVTVQGDEAPLIALDIALDFPWREAAACHRVIVMMTDEPFEDGVMMSVQRARMQDLIRKLMKLRVMLFIVGPASAGFDELAAADRSEYEVVDAFNDGMSRVNFRQVLGYVGKSVSVSTSQGGRPEPVARGLFGQATWGTTQAQMTGR